MNAKLVAFVSASLAGAAAPPAAAEGPLLRLIDRRDDDQIVRVNPRTLEPVSRPIDTFHRGWSRDFSPNGRFLAYGAGARPGANSADRRGSLALGRRSEVAGTSARSRGRATIA